MHKALLGVINEVHLQSQICELSNIRLLSSPQHSSTLLDFLRALEYKHFSKLSWPLSLTFFWLFSSKTCKFQISWVLNFAFSRLLKKRKDKENYDLYF